MSSQQLEIKKQKNHLKLWENKKIAWNCEIIKTIKSTVRESLPDLSCYSVNQGSVLKADVFPGPDSTNESYKHNYKQASNPPEHVTELSTCLILNPLGQIQKYIYVLFAIAFQLLSVSSLAGTECLNNLYAWHEFVLNIFCFTSGISFFQFRPSGLLFF